MHRPPDSPGSTSRLGCFNVAITEGASYRRLSQISLLVMSVLVALIGLMDRNGTATIGLYLTLFGGVAWVVGAAWQLSVSKQDAAPVVEQSVP